MGLIGVVHVVGVICQSAWFQRGECRRHRRVAKELHVGTCSSREASDRL